MMNFFVLTIFPELFDSFWEHGIIYRAIKSHIISPNIINIREFAEGRHKAVDDRPFGGGCGMVMKPEPLAAAIKKIKKQAPETRTVFLSPQGRVFNQQMAAELSTCNSLLMICGRYEGIDDRIYQEYVDFEVSIGDYVITGGELAAMVVIDAVTRQIPGTLGNADSAGQDSFSDALLKHAQFTRPREFEGQNVPAVLLSGNHEAIEKWRVKTALIRTFLKRHDLLAQKQLNASEITILKKWCLELEKITRNQSLSGSSPLPGC